ncbi:hypothetical protein COCOBI_03-2950 [Coccomyxa sp. Obi]|nr:hypothetical protein COCOBI_03-2950 [Coccomyxa sp. Obi]
MPKSLVGAVLPQLRISRSDVAAAAMWGGTAVVGAIWLVQPFGYIRTLIKGPAAPGDEGGPPPAGATGLQEKSDANNADA